MHFQCNISSLLGRMEDRRGVEFTGGSGPVTTALRHGGEAATAWQKAAARCRAWQGQRLSAAPRRRQAAPLHAWAVEDAAGASRLVLAVAIAPRADTSEWTRG
jgi:hypothetical protein